MHLSMMAGVVGAVEESRETTAHKLTGAGVQAFPRAGRTSRVIVGRRSSRRLVRSGWTMKYISQDASGAFDLVRYEDYMEQENEALGSRIRGEALLSIGRFVPRGPESFHDARFDSLSTEWETPTSTEAIRAMQVKLRLRGPFFDRWFELVYEGATACKLEAPAHEDDLLMHEIREERGWLIHEFVFDKGKSIEIVCREIGFLEVLEIPKEPTQ